MKTSHLKRKLALAVLCLSLIGFQAFGTQNNEFKVSDDENQSVKFAINTYANKGLCKVTSSPGRGGSTYSLLFDGSTSSPWVSEEVNPAFIQLAFNDYIELDKIRILPGQPGYPSIDKDDWWVETADTEEEMNNKAGSYHLLVPKRIDVAGVWDEVAFPSTVTTKIVKFHVQRTVNDKYVHIQEIELWGTPPILDLSPGNKFLIIVSSPLLKTGLITEALNVYQNDLHDEGWETALITINNVEDPVADYFTPSEKELKAIIKSFYQIGFDGFFIVGSDPVIPTPKWRSFPGDSWGVALSDMYYADMDEWIDVGNDGIYESFLDEWPHSQPANPENPVIIPEMIFGRLSASAICNSITEEANKVSEYLNRIHDFRTNGSSLSDEQKNRGLIFSGGSKNPPGEYGHYMTKIIPNIHAKLNNILSNADNYAQEIENGYYFVDVAAHSWPGGHKFESWANDKTINTTFDLNYLARTKPKVHVYFMYACSAANHTVNNLGASYLFNNSYGYNVLGFTRTTNFSLNGSFGDIINTNVTFGGAFNEFLKANSWASEQAPAVAILGDPTLIHGRNLGNETPFVLNNLNVLSAGVGKTYTLTPEVMDEGSVSYNFHSMPENASFDGSVLTWTPDDEQLSKDFKLTISATDAQNYSYTEDFIIHVGHFQNSYLTDLDGWDVLGNPAMESYPYVWVIGKPVYYMETNNNWGALRQAVRVKPNRLYKLMFYANNDLELSPENAYIHIEEINERISLADFKTSSLNYVRYGETFFLSNDHSQLTFAFHNGDENHPTSGKVFYTRIRLIEQNECDPAPTGINGNFIAGCDHQPYYWGQESFRPNDAVFTWEENGGIDNSKCLSIDHDDGPNDSRWQQKITDLIPGVEYTLEGFIKGENIQLHDNGNTGANLNININNSWINTSGLSGTFDWQKASLAFIAPESGEVTIQCRLGHFGNVTTGKAWFDDITLTSEINPIIIHAKGSEAGGKFAHFKVLVDGLEVGDSYTSSTYTPYSFKLAGDPSAITEIQIVFDNDAKIDGNDRNLFIKSLVLSGETYPTTGEYFSYVKITGEVAGYTGVMPWNGDLIFSNPILKECEGDIILTTQAEVNVCLCDLIDGNLTISGEDISDLTPLQGITLIGDDRELTIKNNKSLTNLDGLSGIDRLSSLQIINNNALTSIVGLSGLTKARRLTVSNNDALTNLEGLSKLDSLSLLGIGGNDALTNINGLSGLEVVGEIFISNNSALTNLDGLANVKIYGGFGSIPDLTIENNDALTNIDGMKGIRIRHLIFLDIRDNDALANINGLSGLELVDEALISNNSALTNLDGLAEMGGLTMLAIVGNGALLNIDGLSGLTSIGWSLSINNNDALTNLDGLAGLNSVICLYIKDNDALVNIDGLSGLNGNGVSELSITDNNALTNINGLSGCEHLSDVTISNNSALANIDGLATVKHWSTFVNGPNIAIQNNDALTNLDGLSSLISARSLLVDGNEVLSDIDGLTALKSIEVLSVTNNPILTNCCILYPLLNDVGIGEGINVSGNGEGCSGVDILTNGSCPDFGEIIVYAKGSQAGDEFAHFKVLVEGTPIGATYTTSEYKEYRFPIPFFYKIIEDIELVFDNDAVIDGKDRNLYVNKIIVEGIGYYAPNENVIYTRIDGQKIEYNGVMPWNGELLFDLYYRYQDYCNMDFTLSTQAEVDSRAICSEFNGDLTIYGNDISNLDRLSNVCQINGSLTIEDNPNLNNIDGLLSLSYIGQDLTITGNPNLTNCCAMYQLLNSLGVIGNVDISDNGSDCTETDILANGPCGGFKDLFVTAKGSEAGGIFAHFKVMVGGKEVGEASTTSDYTDYYFKLNNNPNDWYEVRIIFDNDQVVDGKDRNLKVQGVQFDGEVIDAIQENVIYFRKDGEVVPYYGTMWWNGDLIFSISNSSARYAATYQNTRSDSLSAELSEQYVNSITIFPNPSHGQFQMELAGFDEGPVQIILYDLSGKLLKSKRVNIEPFQQKNLFEFFYPHQGVYLLKVIDQNKIIDKKVVIH